MGPPRRDVVEVSAVSVVVSRVSVVVSGVSVVVVEADRIVLGDVRGDKLVLVVFVSLVAPHAVTEIITTANNGTIRLNRRSPSHTPSSNQGRTRARGNKIPFQT